MQHSEASTPTDGLTQNLPETLKNWRTDRSTAFLKSCEYLAGIDPALGATGGRKARSPVQRLPSTLVFPYSSGAQLQ
jgi:hypothetical protein